MTDAVAAAGALLRGHLGGDVGVLRQLAFAGGAAHPQVFQRPAEAGHFMQLEVGQGHQGFGLHDGLGQKHGLELLALDLHLHFGLAGEAVGDDQGRFYHRVGKAVFDGGGEMADGLAPGADVHGVGVGEKRPPPQVPNPVHHLAHVHRPDEGGVALLAEMQLHRHQGPLLLTVNDALHIQRIQQPLKLLKIGLLGGGPQIHHKNLAGHNSPYGKVIIQLIYENIFD
jgi:hypothetical protein